MPFITLRGPKSLRLRGSERDREHWARLHWQRQYNVRGKEGGCIVGFVTVSIADESHSLLQQYALPESAPWE